MSRIITKVQTEISSVDGGPPPTFMATTAGLKVLLDDLVRFLAADPSVAAPIRDYARSIGIDLTAQEPTDEQA